MSVRAHWMGRQVLQQKHISLLKTKGITIDCRAINFIIPPKEYPMTTENHLAHIPTSEDRPAPYEGSCECRAVTFSVKGPLRNIVACHCNQCRKSSGHYSSFIRVDPANLHITDTGDLTWFQSTEIARKAFCKTCGSSLFWVLEGRTTWSVHSGAFDGDLPISLSKHIFTSEKGSYYDIKDGLPQAEYFDVQTSQQPD